MSGAVMRVATDWRVKYASQVTVAYFSQYFWGRIQRGGKPLENPPENPPENQLEISYTGKSPKIGSLDMS